MAPLPTWALLPSASAVGPASAYPLPTLAQVGAQAASLTPSAVGPGASMLPSMWQAGNAGTALGPARLAGMAGPSGAGLRAGANGLINSVRGALTSGGGKAMLARGAGAGALVGLVGGVGGGMLDQSELLGGRDSAANDYTSKALKWGGAGAGIGTMIAPGVGTAIGAGVGGLIGLGHEGLERVGVLDGKTAEQKALFTVAKADAASTKIGLPAEAKAQLRAAYEAEMEFIPDSADGDVARQELAQRYADSLQAASLEYVTNPELYATQEQTGVTNDERTMMMQAILVNAVQPYADNYLAQSNAAADSMQAAAGATGASAPIFTAAAQEARMRGARDSAQLISNAVATPYVEALNKQASYLSQISQQTMQQAISQVMTPQTQGASGGMDLTAFIDQQAGALQPQ